MKFKENIWKEKKQLTNVPYQIMIVLCIDSYIENLHPFSLNLIF